MSTAQRFASVDALRGLTVAGMLLVNTPGEGDQFPEDAVKPAFLAGLDALKARNFEAALERFIEVVMKNKDYENGISKDACIAVFYYLGHNHETTRRFRRRFDMALY